MFRKFSVIPNQLTVRKSGSSDVDLSQPGGDQCGPATGGASPNSTSAKVSFSRPNPRDLWIELSIRDRETGKVVPWDWEKSGTAEPDCFLCHVPKASRGARREEMTAGNFRWASTATLVQSGIVTKGEKEGFTFNRAAFNSDGTVKSEVLNLSDHT
jgi:hypothetical protein